MPSHPQCMRCGHVWLRSFRNGKRPDRCPSCHSESWEIPRTELTDIRFGAKGHYLRANHDEIMSFYRRHGDRDTMVKFEMSPRILAKFLNGAYGRSPEMTTGDRALILAEIANAGEASLRREFRELREEYYQFIDIVAEQITSKIVEAVRGIQIRVPARVKELPAGEPVNRVLCKRRKQHIEYAPRNCRGSKEVTASELPNRGVTGEAHDTEL